MNCKRIQFLVAAASLALVGGVAQAVPTTVTFVDTPKCDVLNVPSHVDELGTQVFPINELITSQFFGTTTQTACAMNAGIYTGFRVAITNQSGISWTKLWYVANTETAIVNDDGLVMQEESFLINRDPSDGGMNNPLIAESILNDGIFQPGETWRFLIDGYGNTSGLPPSAFGNIGVPDPLGSVASGSIIATAVPEPGSVLSLVAIGCALLVRQRR